LPQGVNTLGAEIKYIIRRSKCINHR